MAGTKGAGAGGGAGAAAFCSAAERASRRAFRGRRRAGRARTAPPPGGRAPASPRPSRAARLARGLPQGPSRARHRPHRHDQTGRDVRRRGRTGRVDSERRTHGHARRANVGAQVTLCRGSAHGRGGWPASRTSPFPVTRTAVAPKPPIATPASCRGRCLRARPRKRCRSWRGQRSAREDRAERRALVGLDRDPDPIGVVPHARTGESAGCL